MYTTLKLTTIIFCWILCGCKTSQHNYLYYVDKPVNIYEDATLTKELVTVPTGRFILAEAKNPKGKVTYGTTKGFANVKAFKTKTEVSEKDLTFLHFSADSMYTFNWNRSYNRDTTSLDSDSSHHTSHPSSSSPAQPTGGYRPVSVKGYYRKNGTYVKPHTRSAPRRR